MGNLNIDSAVFTVVQDFINQGTLFTALDVSNAVKQTLPDARHREVREVVRGLFSTDMQLQGWDRTPINVQAEDGTTQTALLYHPIADAWNLYNKYDDQQRAKTSFKPVAVAQAVLAQAVANAPSSAPTPVQATQPAATVSISVNVPVADARATWDQLFASQPSLFPVK